MLSSVNENDYFTPKVFPKKHSKHASSKDNKSKDIKLKTRNISSSLKLSVTETTANASDSIKHKKNYTTQFVQPFTYLDPPKVPPSTKNIPPKINNLLTIKQPSDNSNKENETICVNSLFKMKNYQTDLLKYSMTKSRITRQKETKPKLNKLIYAEMNQNFIDKKVCAKSCRDKTLEKESKDAKIKMRFWKGVFDSSYPKIIIKKINWCQKYSNMTLQCFKNRNEINKEMEKKKKFYYKDSNKDIQDKANKEKEKKRVKISSFNRSRNYFSDTCNVNVHFKLGYPATKISARNSVINENYHHKRSQALIN